VVATGEEWKTNWRFYDFGGYAEVWRAACVTLAGQFADHVAAWGEMRPGDHLDLLGYLEEMAYRDYLGNDGLETCYREVVADTAEQLSENTGQRSKPWPRP